LVDAFASGIGILRLNFRILARGLATGDYVNVPNESTSFSFGYLQMQSLKKVLHERIAVSVGRMDQVRDLERGEGRFCFIGLRDPVND
jgi:hypothetical protein